MNKATPPFIHVLLLLSLFLGVGVVSKSDISTGYRMTLTVPSDYIQGFIGKAFLMESGVDDRFPPPTFRTALSVEATINYYDGNQRYSCSLDLYLGTLKVWSSGHRSKFYASEICVLELTQHGDLRLKDSNDQIGWRTGTADQAVQKLKLLDSGNMVLVDSLESVKWQTFNFPTDVLLLGQSLSVATHLLSYPPAAAAGGDSLFYSLEIQHDKLGLYLNTGNKDKYSYWEFEPSKGRNITFVELTSKGVELFDDAFQKFAQIYATTTTPGSVRFLALGNSTGNLGLYYYCPLADKFQASFEALNNTCDLPLACSNNYTICTRTGACSCIVLSTTGTGSEGGKAEGYLGRASLSDSKCGSGDEIGSRTEALLSLCGGDHIHSHSHRDGAEIMVELEAAVTVLRSASSEAGKIKTSVDNVSKEECADMCSMDCECMATLYGRQGPRQCEFYDMVSGVKLKTSSGEPGTYLLKVANPKASANNNNIKSGFRKWVLLLIVASDGLILLFVAAALAYFFIWKRRRGSSSSNSR